MDRPTGRCKRQNKRFGCFFLRVLLRNSPIFAPKNSPLFVSLPEFTWKFFRKYSETCFSTWRGYLKRKRARIKRFVESIHRKIARFLGLALLLVAGTSACAVSVVPSLVYKKRVLFSCTMYCTSIGCVCFVDFASLFVPDYIDR